jgi:hypothetical protein
VASSCAAGACVAVAPIQCPGNLVCASDSACLKLCASSADCVPPGFCSTGGACCAGYPQNTLEVDGTAGIDQACCGSAGGAAACATLAYSVQLAGHSQAAHLTIHVANPPGGRQWIADTFPIQLSYGVILRAPGVAFGDLGTNAVVFTVAPFGAEAATSAVIEGSAQAPVWLNTYADAVEVHEPMTLYVLDAVFDLFVNGVVVKGGATLTLGADGLGASGHVAFGGIGYGGVAGVRCSGTDAQHLAIVNDLGSAAPQSVSFSQNVYGLWADSYCSVSLTAHPWFGFNLLADGTCPTNESTGAIVFDGVSTLSLVNATFQCLGSGALDVFGGTVSFENSGIVHNYSGLDIEHSGTVKLGGGGNTISCNGPGPGVAYSGATGTQDLANVSWDRWDAQTGQTEVWTCEGNLPGQSCTCSGSASCPAGSVPSYPAGVDVLIWGNTGVAIDQSGGAQAAGGCP